MIFTTLLLLVAFQDKPQAPAETPANEDKVICRREVPVGSVMAKKVCRPKSEWAAIAHQTEALRSAHGGDAR